MSATICVIGSVAMHFLNYIHNRKQLKVTQLALSQRPIVFRAFNNAHLTPS